MQSSDRIKSSPRPDCVPSPDSTSSHNGVAQHLVAAANPHHRHSPADDAPAIPHPPSTLSRSGRVAQRILTARQDRRSASVTLPGGNIAYAHIHGCTPPEAIKIRKLEICGSYVAASDITGRAACIYRLQRDAIFIFRSTSSHGITPEDRDASKRFDLFDTGIE